MVALEIQGADKDARIEIRLVRIGNESLLVYETLQNNEARTLTALVWHT